jgi:GT2 family glycosyltransferase
LKISVVVPTLDRPRELRRLLLSLRTEARALGEVRIVDGSADGSAGAVLREFPDLPVVWMPHRPPSAARQRNAGSDGLGSENELVSFLDDDVVLEPGAVENMLRFWDRAGPGIGGASFNQRNAPPLRFARAKTSALSRFWGLYGDRPGQVLPSGFQTLMSRFDRDGEVRWLSSSAVVWRRSVLREYRFDPWFEGYSYLEDLDFSYRVGRRYRLAVVAGAGYHHLPGRYGRGSALAFGRREVVNRLYFVRKNSELSPVRCVRALVLRMGLSLWQGLFELDAHSWGRLAGNLAGWRDVLDRDDRRRSK